MAFNKELDTKLGEKFIPIDEKSGYIVGLYSYNNGEPKFQISSWYTKKDGEKGYGGGRIKAGYIKEVTRAITELYNEKIL